MPEPDYNQGESPPFWFLLAGLIALVAVAIIWGSCS